MAQLPGKEKKGDVGGKIAFVNKWKHGSKSVPEKYETKRWKLGQECMVTIDLFQLRNIDKKKKLNQEMNMDNDSYGFNVLKAALGGKSIDGYTFKLLISKNSPWLRLCFAIQRMEINCKRYTGGIKIEDLFAGGMHSKKDYPVYEALRYQCELLYDQSLSTAQGKLGAKAKKDWATEKEIKDDWGCYISFTVSPVPEKKETKEKKGKK